MASRLLRRVVRGYKSPRALVWMLGAILLIIWGMIGPIPIAIVPMGLAFLGSSLYEAWRHGAAAAQLD